MVRKQRYRDWECAIHPFDVKPSIFYPLLILIFRPDEYLDITCGVDGSVYKKHPSFAKLLQVKTNELVGPGINVNFRLSHDGSGKGAALVTAVSSK